MIENATNLVNATTPISENFLKFLSEYGIEISAFVAIITVIVLVVEMFFRRYLQKKQHEHEKEMERLRQEHNKQAAKEQIIKHLKRFISTEKNGIFKIDDRHQEKIAEVGNDFKKALMSVDKDKILFSQNILEELFVFIDKIRDLSKIRLVPSEARGLNPEFEDVQIQNRKNTGNELVEEANKLIKKLENENHALKSYIIRRE